MIKPGQTYTIPETKDVYLAGELPQGGLFLRDLNRSRIWAPVGTRLTVGYAEGYLVQDETLAHFGYDIEGRQEKPWDHPQPTGLKIADLKPCGVETKVIELWRYSPSLG